jgi:hypothetical protein
MRMKTLFTVLAMLLVVSAATAEDKDAKPAMHAEPTEAELKADVPELHAFHEVIAKMWHDAVPAEDTTMLRLLWPDIVKGSEAVHAAELPGILRDKQEAWKQGLDRLHGAELMYGAAIAAGGKDRLLKAAEDLHTAFEGLVRVIRPAMPELMSFHEVLYKIYHYDLPKKDLASLKSRMPALAAEMDTLNAASLPKHRAAQAADFQKARQQLAGAVAALQATISGSNEWADVEKSVEEMHSAYQGVESVCD